MKEARQIIGDKWVELLGREDKSQFSRIERMIWLVGLLQVDLDMEGFSSIFIDSMSVAELREAISYLKELDLTNIAALLEQALELLRVNGIYDVDWNRVHWNLPEQVDTDFDTIGDKIMEGRTLWQVDDKLAALLQQETDAQ